MAELTCGWQDEEGTRCGVPCGREGSCQAHRCGHWEEPVTCAEGGGGGERCPRGARDGDTLCRRHARWVRRGLAESGRAHPEHPVEERRRPPPRTEPAGQVASWEEMLARWNTKKRSRG